MGGILSSGNISGNYTHDGYTTRISNDRKFVLTIKRYTKKPGDQRLENISVIDNPKIINLLDDIYDINNNVDDSKLFDTGGETLITSSDGKFIYGVTCIPYIL